MQPRPDGEAGEFAYVSVPAFGPFSFGEDANCDLYLAEGNMVHRIVGSAAAAPPSCLSAPLAAPTSVKGKNKCKKKKRSRAKGKRCKKYSAQFGFAPAR